MRRSSSENSSSEFPRSLRSDGAGWFESRFARDRFASRLRFAPQWLRGRRGIDGVRGDDVMPVDGSVYSTSGIERICFGWRVRDRRFCCGGTLSDTSHPSSWDRVDLVELQEVASEDRSGSRTRPWSRTRANRVGVGTCLSNSPSSHPYPALLQAHESSSDNLESRARADGRKDRDLAIRLE